MQYPAVLYPVYQNILPVGKPKAEAQGLGERKTNGSCPGSESAGGTLNQISGLKKMRNILIVIEFLFFVANRIFARTSDDACGTTMYMPPILGQRGS